MLCNEVDRKPILASDFNENLPASRSGSKEIVEAGMMSSKSILELNEVLIANGSRYQTGQGVGLTIVADTPIVEAAEKPKY